MEGRIVRWNDDRGFGFLSSKEFKGDAFAHISQFKKGFRRPKVGDRVLFQLVKENGKQSAKSISLLDVKATPKETPSLSSFLVKFLLFFAIAFGIYTFATNPKSLPILEPFPAYEDMGFSCEGKTHCSQMVSCDEAKFYLAHCPNVKIDGNNDGEPCERQHCNSSR